jgi:hypothetical protein
MLKAIGNVMAMIVVAVCLASAFAAAVNRELALLEGVMLWKGGLVALVYLAFRMQEVSGPSMVSILDKAPAGVSE